VTLASAAKEHGTTFVLELPLLHDGNGAGNGGAA
jgi:hypothetical protein